jgi:hypothetical protein
MPIDPAAGGGGEQGDRMNAVIRVCGRLSFHPSPDKGKASDWAKENLVSSA